MTPQEVREINLSTEKNIDVLRNLVRYWENEAYVAVAKLEEIKTISTFQINETFKMDKIREIIKIDKR